MKKGLVYILINPSMPDWIKIGSTDNEDITQRLRGLNSKSSVPLSFIPYATLSVENAEDVEKNIHGLFDLINPSLRSVEENSKGKKRKREFFQITPDIAFNVLEKVARLTQRLEGLKRYISEADEKKQQELSQKTRRTKMTFRQLDIPIGAKLTFVDDPRISCTVNDAKRSVLYNEKETSLSALAQELSGLKFKPQGTLYWMYQNETLVGRRLRMEKEKLKGKDN